MEVKVQLTTAKAEDGSLRVAFASADGLNVSDHFGWAKTFFLYDVSASGSRKAGKIAFSSEKLDEKGNDDKLSAKIEALSDCHIIYSQAIGGPAAARLTRRKIQPLLVKDEKNIASILDQLVDVLNGPMPPWLRKITKSDDPERFDRFEEDDDEEI